MNTDEVGRFRVQKKSNRKKEEPTESQIGGFILNFDWSKGWDSIGRKEKESLIGFWGNVKRFAEYWQQEKNKVEAYNGKNEQVVRQYLNDRGLFVDQSVNGASKTDASADSGASPDSKPRRNLIYFGAPGTGKSFKLNKNVEAEFAGRYERVTFYPTYSYAQFVGCYKPVMKLVNGKDEIAYEFVPGPFLRVLVNALKAFPPQFDKMSRSELEAHVNKINDSDREANLVRTIPTAKDNNGRSSGARKPMPELIEMLEKYYKNKDPNNCLVIEEINRANAAAVFGDVFQLLDRGGKWSKGDLEFVKPFFKDDAASEYDVAASEDIKRYLKEKLDGNDAAIAFLKVKKDGKGDWEECRLRIPSNMYIWATMNSADQGVFPLDTAFKRRWEFEYIDIDNGAKDCRKWTVEGKLYNWDDFRRFVNGLLSLHGVNEDKLMGARFVTPANGTDTISANSFESKVLMYLWEDAARMCRRQMFDNIKTFSSLLAKWRGNGIGIFEKDAEIKNLTDEVRKLFDNMQNSSDDNSEPDSGDSVGEPQG